MADFIDIEKKLGALKDSVGENGVVTYEGGVYTAFLSHLKDGWKNYPGKVKIFDIIKKEKSKIKRYGHVKLIGKQISEQVYSVFIAPRKTFFEKVTA